VRENLVFDSLIYLEPVDRFKSRSNVIKFESLINTHFGIIGICTCCYTNGVH